MCVFSLVRLQISTLYRSTGLCTLVVLDSMSGSLAVGCFWTSCPSDKDMCFESLVAELATSVFEDLRDSVIKIRVSILLLGLGKGGGCKWKEVI